MPSYVPNTDADRQAMLQAIGVESIDDLFRDIPEAVRHPQLKLPPALSEPELDREMRSLANRNANLEDHLSFLGGGAYRHFIPSVVGHIVTRNEFYTAYTPYQPEISQGTLQAIFEYQTLVCQLTGMDVSNAGLYDGATALAEATLMACRITGRSRVALLDTVQPECEAVVRTYVQGQGIQVDRFAAAALALTDHHACLIVQQPSFLGTLEDVLTLEQAAHAVGALFVVHVDPISLGILKAPGSYGADIVTGEGQALGNPVSFGGPYLGLFACKQEYVRQMPGRIAGRTRDAQGRTGYVLTLQAREQHIRREKATSNVCTNEALMALAATAYLAALGPRGLREVAELCYHKAHYAARRIASLPGYSLPLGERFFKEFVIRGPESPEEINWQLFERGILGGVDVSSSVEGGLLLCVTELQAKADIDRLVAALEAVR